MILPIGHERTRVQRLPYVSFAIVALNAVVFLFTYLREPAFDGPALASAVRNILHVLAEHPYLDLPASFEERAFDAGEKRQLHEELAALRKDPRARQPPDSPAELARQRADLEARCAEAMGLMAKLEDSYSRRLGFVPTERRPATLLTHMFTHADWGHLLGNMLFFYLTGPFLEDVLGRVVFPLFYLASGVAAAYVQSAHAPDSSVPLIGASGAIAGLMGAFLLRFGHTRIRFAYVFGFGIVNRLRGTFLAPAFLVLPFWLLLQILFAAAFGQSAGVAFWAHIGGFLFGGAFAGLLRATGAERWIAPMAPPADPSVPHPGLAKGVGARSSGRLPAARGHLQEAVAAAPDDPHVRLELFRTLAALGDARAAGHHAVRYVELELKLGDAARAIDVFLESADLDPPPTWGAATLLAVGRAAERAGDDRTALETFGLVALRHPREPVAAKSLAASAAIRARRKDMKEAIELLRRALEVPRLDADVARELEARLRSIADSAGLPVPPLPRVAERGLAPPVQKPKK